MRGVWKMRRVWGGLVVGVGGLTMVVEAGPFSEVVCDCLMARSWKMKFRSRLIDGGLLLCKEWAGRELQLTSQPNLPSG